MTLSFCTFVYIATGVMKRVARFCLRQLRFVGQFQNIVYMPTFGRDGRGLKSDSPG